MLKIKDINTNHYTRNWRISYRKSKWEKDDKEEFEMIGNFMDVLHKLAEIGRKDIYTNFTIDELDNEKVEW